MSEVGVVTQVAVIDDETGQREYALGLSGNGFKMEAAYASVEDFLLAADPSPIILLDLWLHGPATMRGLQAVQALRGQHRILIHSVEARPLVLAQLFAAGAHGVISKLASTRELVNAIEAVCRGEVVLTTELAAMADQLRTLGFFRLSPAEVSVLAARARGISVKAIAEKTGWSTKAIEKSITTVNAKVRELFVQVRLDDLDFADEHQRGLAPIIARALGYGPDDLLIPVDPGSKLL